MNNELLISRGEINAGQISETISCGELSILVNRSLDGSIQQIRPFANNIEGSFLSKDTRTLSAEFEEGSVILELQPPDGLLRENSGHLQIPPDRQMLIIDITTRDESVAFTIPHIRRLDDPVVGFSALENRSEEHTSELQSRRDLVCRL